MRAFHMAWLAFFLCFFGWFGVAPLMPIIREELNLTKDQIAWCLIGSVSITILARLIIGYVCDRLGPRKAYAALLIVGAIPIMGIGLAHDFTSFLVLRTLIGVIGAGFVITRTTLPSCSHRRLLVWRTRPQLVGGISAEVRHRSRCRSCCLDACCWDSRRPLDGGCVWSQSD